MNTEQLKKTIQSAEGLSLKPYLDTTGNLTIGFGRNLTGRGITQKEASYLFENDLQEAILATLRIFPQLQSFSESRQCALIEMCFNLGEAGLARFVNMKAAIQRGDWNVAAKEALDSRWAKQVGQRAERIARMIRVD